jgi:hypothetical protein
MCHNTKNKNVKSNTASSGQGKLSGSWYTLSPKTLRNTKIYEIVLCLPLIISRHSRVIPRKNETKSRVVRLSQNYFLAFV